MNNPDNRVPFPKPDKYDPARFELMRRFAKSGGRLGWDLYPLPGGKLDGNNSIGGQFSLGLVGGGNGWSEADAAARAIIWEKHKQYTLEFYHFLTTDPAVPETVRKSYARLGLCKDEFPDYGHFSPALYVREGRRMRGLYVLSQKDILEEPEKQDPIAVSSFPIDSHDCQRIALKDGGVINEGTIFPVRKNSPKQGYAYHVPYRSILPQSKECTNLLVPVALSCTHVGISSLRVEPTWMILGQSAGIAAALSARNAISVQDLPYKQLRDRLLAQGQVLELPPPAEASKVTHSIDLKTLPGIVLDDTSAELSGDWNHSTNFKPHIGSGYLHDARQGDGKAKAIFRFKAPHSGRYQLLMAYSAHETRAKNVPLTVSSGAEKSTIIVDQTRALPQGKLFRPLEIIELKGNTEITITISNDETNGFVILDAIQLLPVK
nr:FAD-dependent oxidoreductase [Gimesia algae]